MALYNGQAGQKGKAVQIARAFAQHDVVGFLHRSVNTHSTPRMHMITFSQLHRLPENETLSLIKYSYITE